jgi:hypothetical protein
MKMDFKNDSLNLLLIEYINTNYNEIIKNDKINNIIKYKKNDEEKKIFLYLLFSIYCKLL